MKELANREAEGLRINRKRGIKDVRHGRAKSSVFFFFFLIKVIYN